MKKISFPFYGLSLRLFLLLTILTVFVFSIIIYLTTGFYTDQIEKNIRNRAIQISNLIKLSTRSSMHKNQREDLALIVSNIGKEPYIEGIRIYNKGGRIEFSDNPDEIHQQVDLKEEPCFTCHKMQQTIGDIPSENLIREFHSEKGERMLGLVNPILNEPDCYNDPCHAHSQEDQLLGVVGINMPLAELDKSAAKTRNKTFIYSGILIILSTLVLGRVIRNQIQRPLSKMLDGMHQVADLNLDYAVDVDAAEDIKDMAITFNKMTKKLKEAQQELQQWSNTLEDKVKEKTRELEGAQRQMLFVEKMASMGKLAAVVAHEINNPMSGILTYAKLLIKNLQNNPSQEVIAESVADLKIIRDESKRCGDVIQNLLQFSKTTNGEKTNCDLKSIIKKSVDLVEHKFEMKEVKLLEDLTAEDTTLLCDSTAIQQIVVSLLINAYEAFPQKGGEVKIRLHKDEAKKTFRLEVTDNGVGIPEDVMPRIFEPFYTTKDAEKNTGLGLAVVYGNVQRYGGSIDVKSKVNEGTTFIINFPINSK